MGGALRRADARRRRRRDRVRARRSSGMPGPDLVRRRLPRSGRPSRASGRRRCSQEFAASGEVTAFQYAPTRGSPGTLDALAGRIESVQGRRPADDELVITSGGDRGARARRQGVPRPGRHSSSSRRPRTSARSWRSAASRPSSPRCRSTTTGSTSTRSRACSTAGCGRSCSTRSPTTRTRRA